MSDATHPATWGRIVPSGLTVNDLVKMARIADVEKLAKAIRDLQGVVATQVRSAIGITVPAVLALEAGVQVGPKSALQYV